MLIKKNKKLTKFIAATIAINTMGLSAVPVVALANDTVSQEENEVAKKSEITGYSESTGNNSYGDIQFKSNNDELQKSLIALNQDGIDDLDFMTKIAEFCQDQAKANGMTSADYYSKLIEDAQKADETAGKNGVGLGPVAESILDINDKVNKITKNLSSSEDLQLLNGKGVSKEELVKEASKVYKEGVKQKKECEQNARKNNGDTKSCKLSEKATAAANYLLTEGAQQINTVSSNPTTTSTVEKAGASLEKQKDTVKEAIEIQKEKIQEVQKTLQEKGTKLKEAAETLQNKKKQAIKAAGVLGVLGAVGAITAMSGHHKDSAKDPLPYEGLQYAFNYQGKKIVDGVPVHMFPKNSADNIEFKLFQYRMPAVTKGQTAAREPKVEAHVMLTMQDKEGKWHNETVVMPLRVNQKSVILPSNISFDNPIYKPLAQYGQVHRTFASDFGMKYYKMVVVINDGVNVRNFTINYDFTEAQTFISSDNISNMKKGDNVVLGEVPKRDLTDGVVQSATWDEASKSCTIAVANGSFTNAAEPTKDNVYDINTLKLDQNGCEWVNANSGMLIRAKGLVETDDGNGKTILSDMGNKESSLGIYEDENSRRNKLNGAAFKAEYKENPLVVPTSYSMQYTDGQARTQSGLYTDGTSLYDNEKNELLDEQKAEMAKNLYETTKNPLYEGITRLDACDSSLDSSRVGMVCGIKDDGSEILISDANSGFKGVIKKPSKEQTPAMSDAEKENFLKNPIVNNVKSVYQKVMRGVRAAAENAVSAGHKKKTSASIEEIAFGNSIYEPVVEMTKGQSKD